VDETAAEAFADHINGWQVRIREEEARLDEWCAENLGRLAELKAQAPALAAGHSLVHFDLRADQPAPRRRPRLRRRLAVGAPRARVVDWVEMAPSVAMQEDPTPNRSSPAFEIQDVTKQAIDAVICTMTGYFVVGALDPPPPVCPRCARFRRLRDASQFAGCASGRAGVRSGDYRRRGIVAGVQRGL